MNSDDLGGLLRWRRDLLDKTQAAVAGDAGTAQATVSRLEQGRRDVRLSTLVEVARALGMDIRIVPREVLPLVDDLIQRITATGRADEGDRPLYTLDHEQGDDAAS